MTCLLRTLKVELIPGNAVLLSLGGRTLYRCTAQRGSYVIESPSAPQHPRRSEDRTRTFNRAGDLIYYVENYLKSSTELCRYSLYG
jgi:hypothetical protein